MKTVALQILTLCLFTLMVFSCKKEDDNTESALIGKWILVDKMVDNSAVALTDCEKQSTITFQADNISYLFDACANKTTNSGWNYKDGMLDISDYLPVAFYIEQLDNTSLKIRRNDISPQGNLQVTILGYAKIN
jgi:Lipocalin-like domain